MKRRMLFAGCVFLLGACFGGASERMRYGLDPDVGFPGHLHRSHAVVRVLIPEAEGAFSGDRISVSTGVHGAFIENAAWAAPLPQVLQAKIIRAFEDSGAFADVEDDYGPLSATLGLEAHIERFTLVTGAGAAHVEVALRVDFFRPEEHRLIKSIALREEEPVSEIRMHVVVPAFERALARCLAEMITQASHLR